ncbi:MAG: hypothetical protein IPN13_25045 [Bacteroidetes bacterium]|nr:hypothetical protein [Bacteroidota bacterium]
MEVNNSSLAAFGARALHCYLLGNFLCEEQKAKQKGELNRENVWALGKPCQILEQY